MSFVQRTKGFSLVELLVVLLIVGLGAGMVMFQVGDNKDYKIRTQVKQLANNLALISEEAVLGNTQWGMDIYREMSDSGVNRYGYRWLFKNEGAWSVATSNEMGSAKLFPEKFELSLEVDGAAHEIGARQNVSKVDEENQIQPDVWIFSSGEITPFTLTIAEADRSEINMQLSADQLARVSLSEDVYAIAEF